MSTVTDEAPPRARPGRPPARLDPGQLALRSAFVRDAMRLLGTAEYARAMKATPRNAAYWAAADPRRPVTDAILRETMQLLVQHRQETSDLIRTVRQHLEGDGDEG